MNEANRDLQAGIDLLAECELGVDERQSLFDRLDRQPDAWKQCALALLEQRALQASLPNMAIVADSLPAAEKPGNGSRDRPTKTVYRSAGKLAGLATAALLLLATGWLIGFRWPAGQPSAVVQAAPGAEQPATDSPWPGLVGNRPELIHKVNLAIGATGVVDGEVLALVGVGDRDDPQIYPIIRSAELSRKMSQMPKPRVPGNVAREIQQTGWKLETHQQFVSIQLPNGQTETLPVGMLNYRYVGRETF